MNIITARAALGLTLFMACIQDAVAQENVVIVLDDSGSMNNRMRSGNTRMQAAKSAIVAVLKQFPRDTKLGLLLLNGDRAKGNWAIPLEPISVGNASRLVTSLIADGGTLLGDKMREGADALLRLREKQIYGTYRLLIVSDGEAEDRRLLDSYLPDILSRGVIVDAIGVDMKQDHALATRVHSYRRADDEAALQKAVQEVFAERIDSSGSGTNDDYAFLSALDEQLAKEVLTTMAKPNNSSIVGVSQSPGANRGDDTTSANVSSPSSLISVFVGMMICAIPIMILFAVLTAAFKVNNKNKRRF